MKKSYVDRSHTKDLGQVETTAKTFVSVALCVLRIDFVASCDFVCACCAKMEAFSTHTVNGQV